MLIRHLLTLCILIKFVVSAESPCPEVFAYDNQQQPDRWHGTITIEATTAISGITLEIQLDRKAVQLGNWFGEVSTKDHRTFVIRNKSALLKVGDSQIVQFYIKYNAVAPRLLSIAINGNIVCSSQKTTEQLNFHPPPAVHDDEDFYPGDFSFINRSKGIDNDLEAVCGTVIARPRPLITHGELSLEGAFPWHVAVYHAKDFDLSYICGGSLLSRHFVITVAHCVTTTKSTLPLDRVNLMLYLGKYYLKQFFNEGIQERSLSKIIIHPEFNPNTFANDIALLRMDKPAEFTEYVRPICLWQDGDDLSALLHKKGRVVGWGYDQTGKITDGLMEIAMPVVSRETCVASFPQFYGRFMTRRTYCAGFRNGSSVCNGDSGGGMVFPRRSDSSVFQLRGLVSISIALRTQFCDTSHYVVFTDTAKYLDWIKSIINV